MIVVAWIDSGADATPGPDDSLIPRIYSLGGEERPIVLIQDRTHELVYRQDVPAIADDDHKALPLNGTHEEGSLRLVVINRDGSGESALRMDSGTITSILGSPLPTPQISGILAQLCSTFNRLSSTQNGESKLMLDLAQILKRMEALGLLLQQDENQPVH
jgi:hypothetical protein